MNELDAAAFAKLFAEAYKTCFATDFSAPLTESESHHLSVEISESTGREIGWKSLKNYSQYLRGSATAKAENPSNQTLDALARYVAGAPANDADVSASGRRTYPYWFRYRESFLQAQPSPEVRVEPIPVPRARQPVTAARPLLVVALVAVLALVVLVASRNRGASARFDDEFDAIAADSLRARGWRIISPDSAHWALRGAKPGHLTLYTLAGDNWPHPGTTPVIRNLLLREAPDGCFTADVRLTDFFPRQDWQQAGIVLLEDTLFVGRSVRLSIGYNDFAGGFPSVAEVLLQGVTALGKDSPNPEEIAHQRLFEIDSATAQLVGENLAHTALRIERRPHGFRLLYAAASLANPAFKEVVSTDFDMRPRYIGLFALKGFVEQAEDMPASIDAFSLTPVSCSE